MTAAASPKTLIATARRMNAVGLNQGASGNLSARLARGDAFLITPSSLDYDEMRPEDVIEMTLDGAWTVAAAGRKPSSEWRFHRDVLAARPEVGAVVHAHPIAATALACHGRGIEPFHYMIALAGGRDIRCAPYATFGTQTLSDHVLTALEGRTACLMAHHGLLATGRDLASALALAVEVETLAKQYIAALAIGPPPLLSDDEIHAVRAKIAAGPGYGGT